MHDNDDEFHDKKPRLRVDGTMIYFLANVGKTRCYEE